MSNYYLHLMITLRTISDSVYVWIVPFKVIRLYFERRMQDNCVYARNLLGRLVSTYGSVGNQQFSQSQTPEANSLITPGTVMIVGAVLLLLFLNIRNRKKTPQSKIQ